MANEHDTVKQSLDALVSEVGALTQLVSQLASAKSASDQSYQDVTAELESLRTQVHSATQSAQQALGSATTGTNFQPSGQ